MSKRRRWAIRWVVITALWLVYSVPLVWIWVLHDQFGFSAFGMLWVIFGLGLCVLAGLALGPPNPRFIAGAVAAVLASIFIGLQLWFVRPGFRPFDWAPILPSLALGGLVAAAGLQVIGRRWTERS